MAHTFLQRLLFLVLIAIGLTSASATRYEELPATFAGTMRPYDFVGSQTEPIWPDSLRPVKVAYVARHGARYLSSRKKITEVEKYLSKAREAGTITAEGKAFQSLLDEVSRVSEGKWGLLSEVGADEEQRLASELCSLCPELMKNARVEAIATYVPRVVMTMYEFCHSLSRYSNDITISASEGKRYSPLLRFYNTNPAYNAYLKDGPWKKTYDDFISANVPTEPAQRLVGMRSHLTTHDLQELTLAMYEVLQGLRAFSMPAPTTRWMSPEEYRRCWEAENLYHYLCRSDNPVSVLAPRCAAPLLESVMSALLNPESPQANLYFGHAETIMPLVALMRLPGCDKPGLSADEVATEWVDGNVSPLGANVLIVSLQAPSGRRYAAVRLNGRFVAPIESSAEKIVEMQQLIAYWMQRIAHFQA